MKYILFAFVILTVFVGMQHAAAQNTGNMIMYRSYFSNVSTY